MWEYFSWIPYIQHITHPPLQTWNIYIYFLCHTRLYFCMLCQKAHPTVSFVILLYYTQCTLFTAHMYMLQCSITHIAIPLFCATLLVDKKKKKKKYYKPKLCRLVLNNWLFNLQRNQFWLVSYLHVRHIGHEINLPVIYSIHLYVHIS